MRIAIACSALITVCSFSYSFVSINNQFVVYINELGRLRKGSKLVFLYYICLLKEVLKREQRNT